VCVYACVCVCARARAASRLRRTQEVLREDEESRQHLAWLESRVSTQQEYLGVLDAALRLGTSGVGPNGATFKRSTEKGLPELMFLAVNLHTQEMRVREMAAGRAVAVAIENEWWNWLPSALPDLRGDVAPPTEGVHAPRPLSAVAAPAAAAVAAAAAAAAAASAAVRGRAETADSDGGAEGAAAGPAAVATPVAVRSGGGGGGGVGITASPGAVARAAAVGISASPAHTAAQVIYDTVSVGAFTAIPLGFRASGLRQMLQAYAGRKRMRRGSVLSLNADMREQMDLAWAIEQRIDVVVCQAATALVTAFARKVRLVQRYMTPYDGRTLLEQYARTGFLFSVESLLSTAGSEIGMLGDFDVGMRMLSTFSFRLRPPTAALASGAITIAREGDRIVVELHVWPSSDVVVVKPGSGDSGVEGPAEAAAAEEAAAAAAAADTAATAAAAAAAAAAKSVPASPLRAPAAAPAGAGAEAAPPLVLPRQAAGKAGHHPLLHHTSSQDSARRGSAAGFLPGSPGVAPRPRFREWVAMADREQNRRGSGAVAGSSVGSAAGSYGTMPDAAARGGGGGGASSRGGGASSASAMSVGGDSDEGAEGGDEGAWDEGQRSVVPESLRDGALITVVPVLFSQGINEMQTVANLVPGFAVELQEEINVENLGRLRAYCSKYKAYYVAEMTEMEAAARARGAAGLADPGEMEEVTAECARRREKLKRLDGMLTSIAVRSSLRRAVLAGGGGVGGRWRCWRAVAVCVRLYGSRALRARFP
jgi:hypothetical protein